MIKKPYFLLAICFLGILSLTACKNDGACDDVTDCPESFVLTENPDNCCFRLDNDGQSIPYSTDIHLDLNQDGVDDLFFDGEETGSGQTIQREITMRPENDTEIMVTVSSQIKVYGDGDELVTPNEIFRDVEPVLVRITNNSELNNWPSQENLSIMGLKIPVQGSTTDFDYAYICMRVETSVPSIEIAYLASQFGN